MPHEFRYERAQPQAGTVRMVAAKREGVAALGAQVARQTIGQGVGSGAGRQQRPRHADLGETIFAGNDHERLERPNRVQTDVDVGVTAVTAGETAVLFDVL